MKINKTERIEEFFNSNQIPYEIHATKQAGDSFTIPHELDLDEYSALIACGGDGTVFEVINGMLERQDNKRLPIGVIPNGSGNGIASGIGIRDTDMALEAIKTQIAFKADLFRVLSDTENNDDIPRGREAFKTRRSHSALCLYFGGFNALMEEAIPLKPYLGTKAYDVMIIKHWMTG